MADLASLIETYQAGPKALRQAVAGMTREQLTARPIPGKWSTLEVVAHLADFDPILADRMKRIIAEDNPPLLGANHEKFLTALAYHERDLEEELTIIEQTRKQMVRILRTLPNSVLERVGIHSERGPVTLEKTLTITNNHITHHAQFIQEKRKALGLPTTA